MVSDTETSLRLVDSSNHQLNGVFVCLSTTKICDTVLHIFLMPLGAGQVQKTRFFGAGLTVLVCKPVKGSEYRILLAQNATRP